MTTLGKYRHLMQSSTPAGHFTILAIDHRAVLRDKLNQYAPQPLADIEFAAFKQQIIRHLLPAASAVLVDPEYGLASGIAYAHISGQVGLLSPLEITDYADDPAERTLKLISGWSVAKIKRAGCSGVKMLIAYHPDAPNIQQVMDIVRRTVDDCARYDIPFFPEPIPFSLDSNRPLDKDAWRQLVIESAKTFSDLGVDILKLPFPVDVTQESSEGVWQAACAEVDAACAVPWALLSAGVSYETFKRQAEIACQAGASGVIVGRAVWGEAVELQGAAREEFLQTTARQRMDELAAVCEQFARPWYKRATPPDDSFGWHVAYAE